MAMPKVEIPWSKNDAIRETELQCKSLDRDYTKESKPCCPDASKVMEGEFTYIPYQGIWLIK